MSDLIERRARFVRAVTAAFRSSLDFHISNKTPGGIA